MHSHGKEFVEKIRLSDGFSFHPRLAEWLKSLLKLQGDEMIAVYEAGCTEESCPIEETVFEIEKTDETVRLKIGRVKNQISKNDLFFAIKKQF